MISRLFIQNYAIIDQLDIHFSDHLNIITGETGAGKSILMGALNLILGERADTGVLLHDNKKCVVEGYFTLKGNEQVTEFLKVNDLDNEDEIVLRREISANGKSRSFINDTPANLIQLKQLAGLLVDLHQQFDTLDLSSENFQRTVLDALAANSKLLQTFDKSYSEYMLITRQLQSLQSLQSTANKELDYNKFLFDELEELALKENELEELDTELSVLNNAENIKQQLAAVYFELKESEQPITQQLKLFQQKLSALQQYHPSIEELQARLKSAELELRDVADELEQIDQKTMYDASRIDQITERINVGYKLQKKHGVTSTSELLAIQQQLSDKLLSVTNASAEIEKLQIQSEQLKMAALKTAKSISENRIKAVKPFVEKVNFLLAQVGMPNARIQVKVEPVALTSTGTDSVEFLFDANKSGRFEPIRKVASGGELSRLMLSIKSLVAKKLQLPTLIFDEIDTGISGEAAKQVGIIMKDLSTGHQIISITHQPQIAAKADAHYFVYKSTRNDKIITSIKLLSGDERISTIAQMLSGEKPTAAALANAKEMVGT